MVDERRTVVELLMVAARQTGKGAGGLVMRLLSEMVLRWDASLQSQRACMWLRQLLERAYTGFDEDDWRKVQWWAAQDIQPPFEARG